MTIKNISLKTIIIILFYPLFTLFFLSDTLETPFAPETITRFIIPFEFHNNNNLTWSVMESTQWEIFRPVYSTSVLLDYTFWNTQVKMYHVTDILLSWLCYIILFLLFKKHFILLSRCL